MSQEITKKRSLKQLLQFVRSKKAEAILLILLVFILVVSIIALFFLPERLALEDFNRHLIDYDEFVELRNDYVRIILQVIGGLAAAIALILTFRRIKAIEKNAEIAQKTLQSTIDGQLTDRFAKAIEQLGSEQLAIKLGGIYSLERIAKESEKDYTTVMEVLNNYVRDYKMPSTAYDEEEKLKDDYKMPTDIHSALLVLFRNRHEDVEQQFHIDLSSTHLARLNLPAGTDCRNTYLFGANLEGASLFGAKLRRAYLSKAYLEGAYLERAHLSEAYLFGAKVGIENLKETITLYQATLPKHIKKEDLPAKLFEEPIFVR